MGQEFQFEQSTEQRAFDEATATKILQVADRLQMQENDKIDEARLHQIADEVGLKPEYVRLAIGIVEKREERTHEPKVGLVKKARERYDQTTGHIRQFVNAGLAGLLGALGMALSVGPPLESVGVLCIIASVLLGINFVWRTRSAGRGAIAGMIFGAVFTTIGSMLLSIAGGHPDPEGAIGGVFGGLFLGLIIGAIGSASVPPATLLNPRTQAEDRQDLLRQLYTLQDKLRQGTRNAAFLSVDVVNSTGMKFAADPLAVEYSFGAYQRLIADVARSFGGQVHSTAGDGCLCAFESPEKAYQAARTLQRSIGQFNANENRLGNPFTLRCGIHSGNVVAPSGDLRGVEFTHVIDLAAHLQKSAPVGGIVLSAECAAGIFDPVLRLGLVETVVDGQPAFVFSTPSA